MSNAVPTPEKRENDDVTLPPIGEAVLVQFDGFRCMAFRDKDGKWRDCVRKEELQGNVQTFTRLF